MYIVAIVFIVVLPSESTKDAFQRGAVFGFVAYVTYALTHWVVIAGWPSLLVLIDILWGVLATSVSAAGAILSRFTANERK